MYQTLFTKVLETLNTVQLAKDVFYTPKSPLEKFPSVFVKPMGFSNAFETRTENAKTYRFLVLAIVGANGTTIEAAFGEVLPKIVDQIVAAFDEQWNAGTVDGHRVTVKVDSADAWEVSQENEGLVAYAPLNVEIRLLTNTG